MLRANDVAVWNRPKYTPLLLVLLSLALSVAADRKGNAVDYCEWKKARFPKASKLYSDSSQLISLTIGNFVPSIPIKFDEAFQLSDTLLPAVKTALNDLNHHACILNGYRLTVDTKDTKCEADRGTKAFFDIMHKRPRRIGLFGDACTSVNEPIAVAAKHWHMIQISYAETHPIFAAADSMLLYPSFYRMVPGDTSLHKAKQHFLHTHNWTRVGSIKQADDRRYALPHEHFTTSLEQHYNINVIYTAELSSEKLNIVDDLVTLKEKDARVIVADFNSSYAVRVMCEAYRKQLYGVNYVWILTGNHRQSWWTDDETALNRSGCSLEQLLEALSGHFIMEFTHIRADDEMMGISGKTASDFLSTYSGRCASSSLCSPNDPYIGYVYDGIFTFGLALDAVISKMAEHDNVRFDPKHLDAKDAYIQSFFNDLQGALNDTNFQGVTGKVMFSRNERLGRIRIAQFINRSYITVGEYDSTSDRFFLNIKQLEENGWRAPLDHTQVVHERSYVDFGLYVFMSMLASFGVLLACVFLAINVHFRAHKFIRMSSPNLNNLITIGSVLTYLSVILLGVDTRIAHSQHAYAGFCYAKVWILSIGYTLAFGSMFSKTWRVHSIFTNIKLNKKAISDYKLFLIVGVLLLIDTVVLAVWAGVAPMSLNVTSLASIRENDRNRVIIPTIEKCHSDHALVFQAILYGFKGLLMVMGCFLAWETRQVNIPALNDSKYIGMSVYNVVLMSVLGVSLSFILEDRIVESYILTSLFIIFCTTLTLCLVFVPKIIELVRNPKGTDKKYRKGMMKSVVGPSLERDGSNRSKGSDRQKLMRLEQDNQVWQKFLQDKTTELMVLVEQLEALGGVWKPIKEESSATESDEYGGVYMGPPETLKPEDRLQLLKQEAEDQNEKEEDDVDKCVTNLIPLQTKSSTAENVNESTSLLRQCSSKRSSQGSSGSQQTLSRLRSQRSNRVSSSCDDRSSERLPFSMPSSSLDQYVSAARDEHVMVEYDDVEMVLNPLKNGTMENSGNHVSQVPHSESLLSSNALSSISERYSEQSLGTSKHRDVHVMPEDINSRRHSNHKRTSGDGKKSPARRKTSSSSVVPHYVVRYCPWLDPGQHSTLL